MKSFSRSFSAVAARRPIGGNNLQLPYRCLHASAPTLYPRKRNFFSSNATLQQDVASPNVESTVELKPVQKRKPLRSPAGKTSLRRVAVEAQRSRQNITRPEVTSENVEGANRVIAISVADHFDMEAVARILRSHGSLVAWSLPEDVVTDLATKTLLPAAVDSHVGNVEIEDLECEEDPKRENSSIRGDTIVLGTKDSPSEGRISSQVDTTLAKIAFSSGLARSTKLAVLETMLSKYFESTKSIPTLLSRGSRLPFNRQFMLQKTGELLDLRARLNHYSELTDSLPDLFWDSRHELGLEGYYDQVGRALDVGVRIKTLNQKMDYAQEIATILRETMSEKHSIHLEWIIIVLIAVEVGFELRRLWKERSERLEKEMEKEHGT
ncbi:YagE family protein [Botrytis cinerea]